MNKSNLLIFLAFLVALLLASCSAEKTPPLAVPAEAEAGELTGWEACEYQVKGSETKYAAECGTLVVPENWNVTGSRLIALPVIRLLATGQSPAEPLFYLEGGPGMTNMEWPLPGWALEDHDVVMVGYRGVDGSVALTCPELGRRIKAHLGKDLFSEKARQEYRAATEQCAEDLQRSGVDLLGYTIPGVIEDIEVVRKALGYDRINLFSQSYGTRIAQIYAYMYPNSLHRLVLVGVNTPGRFTYSRDEMDEMVRYLARLCAQDTACSSRTDDLAQTISDVNHNMPERWLFFKIDPGTLRLGVHTMFYNNPNMAMIFDVYLAAADGDASGLAMGNLYSRLMFPVEMFVYGDTFSKGSSTEKDKFGDIESVSLGDSIMGAPWAEYGTSISADWPVELISDDLREFQESDVEMLLVNGTLDFSTPPYALEEARPYYHKAQMVLLPEFSHVWDVFDIQPEAFERLITSYYDTGVADSSLYVYEPLSFEPDMSLTVLAKRLVAAIVIVLVLLVLGAVLVVRLVQRRANKSQVLTKQVSPAT